VPSSIFQSCDFNLTAGSRASFPMRLQFRTPKDIFSRTHSGLQGRHPNPSRAEMAHRDFGPCFPSQGIWRY
jgi:hypothetical protein